MYLQTTGLKLKGSIQFGLYPKIPSGLWGPSLWFRVWERLPFNGPERPKVRLAGHDWAGLGSFLAPYGRDASGPGWGTTPLACTLCRPGRGEPPGSEATSKALTLMEVSPPCACCSRKTWATMCSVEGCSRILREAKPTITYRPIGDRLTEMALGPEGQKHREAFPRALSITSKPSSCSLSSLSLLFISVRSSWG